MADSKPDTVMSELVALAREEKSVQTTVRITERNLWRFEKLQEQVKNLKISAVVNRALDDMFDQANIAEPPADYGYR